MKQICILLFALLTAGQLPAAPVKLAIVLESPEAADAADLLAVEFTKNDKVQLLERAEIEKVYREQGLSAANRNFLKLGQILGADGLLVLKVSNVPMPANIPMFAPPPKILAARLIAVTPGVVLMDGSLSWPVKDTAEWSRSFAAHLNLLMPKLGVLVKDAIPLSVVNLRSAIKSEEEKQTEQEVKLLTIQRLSEEPQFFVLERQQMQLLGEEKDLKSDEPAFWNGSYLLEGVIDQNGYSKDVITIHARLTPPQGGEPLLFEVSGSRTNLAEPVNKLAAKVAELLKVNSATREWNAADEAAQYFGEAQWALRWKSYSEAQMAADSAWALGKKDLDCGLLRIRIRRGGLSAAIGDLHEGTITLSSTYDLNGNRVSPPPSTNKLGMLMQGIKSKHKFATMTKITFTPDIEASYVWFDAPPAAENIEQAIELLTLYGGLTRISPDSEPKILSRGKGWNDWHNSEWYQMGIENLVTASKVLQIFNLVPEAQEPVADKLAELRSLARSTAEEIAAAPSVHDSYFVGDRMVSRDELSHTMGEHDSIFRCEINWGCYWQEKPEGSVALYRELLTSPVFRYLHHDFWNPKPPGSRLVAWNAEDQKRIPVVWNNFVRELGESTNVLWQMEAKGLMRADATDHDQAQAAEAGWWSIVRSNREELVQNNVELFYLGWGFAYNAETEAMDQEYFQKTVPAGQMSAAFKKQKRYLASFTPYDRNDFNATFQQREFTKAQAAELQPLIVAYKSNILAQVPANATPLEKLKGGDAVHWIGFYLEQHVNSALNPTPPPKPPVQVPASSPPASIVQKPAPQPVPASSPELVTNAIAVTQFLPIPLVGLPGDKISAVTITAHHWLERKLLLDFQYNAFVYSFDEHTNWTSTRNVTFPAIAILDPATEHWEVIVCPEANIATQSHFYHHTTLLHGELFNSDGGQIRKYDFKQRQWQVLACSSGDNYELFTVNGNVYAANANLIFQITDGGKSTRILASSRRQPPVSVLDTQELGTPVLFAGADNSLRVATRDKVFTWTGGDWREDGPAPASMVIPEIFPEGVLFRHSSSSSGLPDNLSRLLTGRSLERCLGSKVRPANFLTAGTFSPGSGEPIWKLPPQMHLENLAAALWQSNLCLLAEHSEIQQIANDRHEVVMEKVVAQNGYNAALLCYSQGLPGPQKVFLNFDAPGGCPPVTGTSPLRQGYIAQPPALLVFADHKVLFASESPVSIMPVGIQRPPIGYNVGVWVLPVDRLIPVIAAQKKLQLAETAQTVMSQEQAAKNLLAKYDQNHDGVIDPDEREGALDDPVFIKTKLDEIDANHNGWLDPAELAWFDANHNKVLDPKEQTGIELTQKLLAEKLLGQFDGEENGSLNRMKYREMIQSCFQINTDAEFDLEFSHADSNHDNHLDLEELESLMHQRLERQMHPRWRPSNFQSPPGPVFARPADRGNDFKSKTELYWQNPDAATNPASLNGRSPSGTGNP